MQGARDWKKHLEDTLRYVGFSRLIDLVELLRNELPDDYRSIAPEGDWRELRD